MTSVRYSQPTVKRVNVRRNLTIPIACVLALLLRLVRPPRVGNDDVRDVDALEQERVNDRAEVEPVILDALVERVQFRMGRAGVRG